MIVADFSMIPMGSGTSGSRYVKAIHEVLKSSGVNFVSGPITNIRIDCRLDKEISIRSKLKAVGP